MPACIQPRPQFKGPYFHLPFLCTKAQNHSEGIPSSIALSGGSLSFLLCLHFLQDSDSEQHKTKIKTVN